MAKRQIINVPIPNMSQRWGGKNNTGAAQTILGVTVPAGYEWALDFSQIEDFLKGELGSRIGALHVDSGRLYGFASAEDRQAWIDEPDNSLVVDSALLPVGGDTANDALAIFGIDSTQYYKKDSEQVVLKFKVRNIVEGEPSTDIAVTVLTPQGASLFYASRPTADSDGFYTATFEGSKLRNVANATEHLTLKVERTGEDREVTRSLTMYCIDLGLELYSGFNFGVVNPQSISYVPTFTLPSGVSSIKLVVDVYRSSTTVFSHIETTSITTNNRAIIPLDWTDLPFSGVYKVKAYLDMGGGLIQSEVVETNVMCVLAAELDSTSLIAIEPIGQVTLYDDITPRIAAYNKGEETAMVRIALNGGTPTLLEIPCNRVYSEYVVGIEEASNTLIAQVIENGEPVAGAVETFAASGSFDWRTVSGYLHHLVGKGRSNGERPTPADWGGITTFYGFSWDESGSCWKNNALHLAAGSSAVIAMRPFYSATAYNENRRIGGGILDTGRTFRIRYKVGNVSDVTKHIIECYDGNVGFFVTADTIYVKMGAGGEIVTDPYDPNTPQASQNNRHFSPDEEVELGITVEPYWDESYNQTNHAVTMYINGQFAGRAILSNTTLSQSEALPVTLHADGCELDVSVVTDYDRCLDSFEMLQNFVMGMGNLADMRDEFNRNQCYVGNGTVNLNQTFKYCCDLSAKLGDTVEGTCNIVVDTHEFDPNVNQTDVVAPGKQELSLYFFRNGDVDTTRSVKYVANKDGALRTRIQGTSTAFEFRKNKRHDGRGKDSNDLRLMEFRWSREAYEAGGSSNPEDGWVGWDAASGTWSKTDGTSDRLVKKMAIYLRGNSSTENACSLLTTKTNYNESTATRNLPSARWIDDAIRYLATQRDGNGNLLYPDILTPPQRSDSKVRQAIDGLPAVQFTHAPGSQDYQFTGKVDMITDKKNSSVFGFSDNLNEAHPDYSIEFRNGNTDVCNFRCPYLVTAGKYLSGNFATADGQDCFEYRWPDLDTGDCYYGDGILGPNSAMQRLFDFVFNCHPDFMGYKSKNGLISATNGIITIRGEEVAESRANRLRKFYSEMSNYAVKSSFTINGFASKVDLWVDQRAKNQFFTHYHGDEIVSDYTDDLNVAGQTYEVLRLLPYDIDSSKRGDNDSRLRYDFTRLYTDANVFTDSVGVTTISEAFYPTQSAIPDAAAFIADRVKNRYDELTGETTYRRSALYELIDETCTAEYAAFFGLLGAQFLTVDAISRYCIAEEADAYNSVIYNADTAYKYVASGKTQDQRKAHGSAKEDLLWWIRGRMYFMGGENKAGDFMASSITFNMAQDSQLDAANRAIRLPSGATGVSVSVRSRYRNYIGARQGTTGNLRHLYAEDPSQYYDVMLTAGSIDSEDAQRFSVYGQKFFDDISDLSQLYISSITSWGGFTSMKTLKFGDGAEGFENPVLTSIKGGVASFGACETVDLRHCTAYADSNFRTFPAAKTLLLTGCDSLTELNLPVTDNLETLALPKNITELELTGKTKLSALTLENGGSLSAITCSDIGNTTAAQVLAILHQLYN